MTPLISLLNRDEIKVTDLKRIYAAYGASPGFAPEALRAMQLLDTEVAWRAVWLLKQLARDRRINEADLIRLADTAEQMTHWASRLNLCQLFAVVECPPAAWDVLYPYLLESFRDRRPIIRAWAITNLVGYRRDPRLRREIQAVLRKAQSDPAPSMQARLRLLAHKRK